MLFPPDDIDSTSEELLFQMQAVQARSISPPVERLDGKRDKWVSQYLCVAQPLVPFTYYAEGLKVKLSDMGGGQSLYSLRPSPSQIISKPWFSEIDV